MTHKDHMSGEGYVPSVADAPRESSMAGAARRYVAPPGVEIEFIGGNCPVQGEGTVDGKEFYFRARGNRWSMSIGGLDTPANPEWYYEERYGEEPYAAGWMSKYEAHNFVEKAIGLYRSAQRSDEPQALGTLRASEASDVTTKGPTP